jgi:vacuolar-type H+-ATPase subunit H
LNEKRIQQVLDIEREAEAIRAKAVSEAEQIPVRAEQESQELIEKARAAAQEEARRLLLKAQAEQESAGILSETEERVRRIETTAMRNFDRAVTYVLNRVVGRE